MLHHEAKSGGNPRGAASIVITAELLDQAKAYLGTISSRGVPSAAQVTGWRQFYRQCDALIRRFVRVYVSSASDMDDCAQEVWLKLVDKVGDFEYDPARGAFSSWMYRVVRDTTVSYFRHEHRFRRVRDLDRQAQPVDHHAGPASLAEREDQTQRVTQMLLTIRRHVSRPNYELLRMRWLQGRSVEEVARVLGISHEQVWYREHRVKKKLREVFSHSG